MWGGTVFDTYDNNYVQDGVKWLNSQNQWSNVGKDTVMMAKLRWVRILHKCHGFLRRCGSVRGRHGRLHIVVQHAGGHSQESHPGGQCQQPSLHRLAQLLSSRSCTARAGGRPSTGASPSPSSAHSHSTLLPSSSIRSRWQSYNVCFTSTRWSEATATDVSLSYTPCQELPYCSRPSSI